jgi:DNA repair exonuclease SbcCD ATPase subunit
MIFKTKERDIDKANIKIDVLEWQLKELMGMYGESINECTVSADDARRLRKELKKNNNTGPYLQEVIKDRDGLQKEVDRLRLVLKEKTHLEFGLDRDERKILLNNIYRLRTKYIKAMKEHKDTVQEQNTLLTDKKRLERDYDDIAGLYSRLLQECDSLLTDKKNLEKKNQGLELDIEGMKGDYKDIVTECCDLIHEREGFLMGKRPLDEDKKGFIERETRIISRTELMIILEDYYKVTEVELGKVRVGTPTHYISTVPLTACSSQLVNIQIAYRKKVDKE